MYSQIGEMLRISVKLSIKILINSSSRSKVYTEANNNSGGSCVDFVTCDIGARVVGRMRKSSSCVTASHVSNCISGAGGEQEEDCGIVNGMFTCGCIQHGGVTLLSLLGYCTLNKFQFTELRYNLHNSACAGIIE